MRLDYSFILGMHAPAASFPPDALFTSTHKVAAAVQMLCGIGAGTATSCSLAEAAGVFKALLARPNYMLLQLLHQRTLSLMQPRDARERMKERTKAWIDFRDLYIVVVSK
jgi:hypothetical protein